MSETDDSSQDLQLGQFWLSPRTSVWWCIVALEPGKVLVTGPKGSVRCGSHPHLQWPISMMTYSGFMSWIRTHSATLLPKASAAEISKEYTFPNWRKV